MKTQDASSVLERDSARKTGLTCQILAILAAFALWSSPATAEAASGRRARNRPSVESEYYESADSILAGSILDDDLDFLSDCDGACSDVACDECGPIRYPCWTVKNRLWFRGEYLLWWSQGDMLPPLVSTSPAGTARADAGRLDQGASILFGDAPTNEKIRSGGRLSFGYLLGSSGIWSAEGSYLALGQEVDRFSATSDGSTILARPFFNVLPAVAREDALLVAFPGAFSGSLTASETTEFQMAEASLRRSLFTEGVFQMDLILGYRYGRLQDTLQISSSSTSLAAPPAVGTTIAIFDEFGVKNQFHGGQFGFVFQEQRGRWAMELVSKLALGSTRSTVDIRGTTTTTPPGGAAAVAQGGLMALSSNSGHYEHSDFAVIPELGLTLNYALTPRLQLTFGYTFIYWSKLARPGGQIDRDVNTSLLPPPVLDGAARPEFTFTTTDYWTQGMNLGFEYRF